MSRHNPTHPLRDQVLHTSPRGRVVACYQRPGERLAETVNRARQQYPIPGHAVIVAGR